MYSIIFSSESHKSLCQEITTLSLKCPWGVYFEVNMVIINYLRQTVIS